MRLAPYPSDGSLRVVSLAASSRLFLFGVFLGQTERAQIRYVVGFFLPQPLPFLQRFLHSHLSLCSWVWDYDRGNMTHIFRQHLGFLPH